MKTIALLTAICCWVTLCTLAQTSPYHYSVRAGVPAQLVYGISQDANGRLIIATDEGLFRYNGFHTKHFTAKGISSREITQMVRYGESFLLSNRSGQLLKLEKDKLKAVSLNGFTGDIRQLLVRGKELIITGSRYIHRFSLPELELKEQLEIPFIESTSTNAIHVLPYGNSFLALLNTGELINVKENEARTVPGVRGAQLSLYHQQVVILPAFLTAEPIITFSNSVFHNKGIVPRKGNLHVNQTRVIGKRLYVLTDNGIIVFNGGIGGKTQHWFSGTPVTDLFKDRAGNLWVATKGKGLLLVPADKHEIIYEGSLLSLIPGPKGSFFGGTLNGGIVQFSRSGKELKQFTNPINVQEAQFIYYDRVGQLLFSNTGLFSTQRGNALNQHNESLKGAARLTSGGVYLAKSNGVIFIPKTGPKTPLFGLTDSSKMELLRAEPARNLSLNEQRQEVAFCTVKGVFLHQPGTPVREITLNGKSLDAQALCWFHEELIIATTENELLRVRDGKVVGKKALSFGSGEFIVRRMLSDESFVYLLTENGMHRFKDLGKKTETLRELSGTEGIVMRDFALANGKLYVLTQNGVLYLPWNETEKADYSMVVYPVRGSKNLEYEIIDGIPHFPHGEKLIVVPFECVDLTGNHPFIVRYSLHYRREKGYWNALPADLEQLNLSYLSPGDYTIEFYLYDPVTGAKSDVQRQEFTVLYAWYNRPLLWWTVLFIAILTVAYLWRRSLLKERRKEANLPGQ